jgi:hypothetical protein
MGVQWENLPAKLDFAGMEIKFFKYLVPLKDES